MTPDQKRDLMQLMGQTYGEAHKNDQMIIGRSGNLTPTSHQLKAQFEQVAKTPAYQQQNAPAPAPVQEPVATHQPVPQAPPGPVHDQAPPPGPVQPVSMEQAARELAQAEAPSSPVPVSNNQLELDLSEPTKVDKLIKLVEEHTLLLKEISLKLGDGKKVKPSKKG